MNQTLYRKYRPKTFNTIEGQKHVTRTLRGAVISGRIGHAYLFTGPRGTGKTTLARLFAKILNCEKVEPGKTSSVDVEPCNVCFSCNEINENRSLDLIEIDAASNRGIDEIRNLKESARVSASSSRYKVFIIDEVHMLTTPAFNALLKTLEEPPAHVVFILATTEAHKVPETILSRVQRLDFKKLSQDQIVQKLEKVAKMEKIKIEKPALASIASYASGSLRDAESAFAKIIAYGDSQVEGRDTISSEYTADVLGIIPSQVHDTIFTALRNKNSSDAIAQVSSLYESGTDLEEFTKQFIQYLRSGLISLVSRQNKVPQMPNTDLPTPEFFVKAINKFMEAKAQLKFSPVPQLPLELAILDITR